MYKLFTDKTELFECDIKLEGASLKNSQARLIIESSEISLLFKGEITSSGKCKIPVKKLKGLLEENAKGNIKLEVIADDTYFTPWESKFEVDTSKKVTVEIKSQQAENLITDLQGLDLSADDLAGAFGDEEGSESPSPEGASDDDKKNSA